MGSGTSTGTSAGAGTGAGAAWSSTPIISLSISPNRERGQVRAMRRRAGLWCPAVCTLLGPGFALVAHAASCTAALGAPAAAAGPLKLEGLTPVTAEIAVTAGHPWLIEVQEHGNDAVAEILDAKGQVVGRTDHPE